MNRAVTSAILAAITATTALTRPAAAADAPAAPPSATRPATSPAAAPTPEQLKALRAEAEVLKGWADAAAPQYGASHPSVAVIRARAKQAAAAVAANRLPPAPPPVDRPADALARRELEDEIEVHVQWLEGMERGYGADHPAVAFVRDRVRRVEAALAPPPKGNPATRPAAGGAGR